MEEISTSFTKVALNSYNIGENANINITHHTNDNPKKVFNNNEFNNMFENYRTVVLNSLITAFGLDKIIFRDRDGGNVQTMYNAENQVYSNDLFQERGERLYNRDDYATSNYMNKRRKNDFNNNDKIHDGYTGKELPKDGRANLEHIVSAKENHERTDMRILYDEKEMSDIINSKENTTYINSSMNKSKGANPLKEWENKTSTNDETKTNAEYYGVDSKKAHEADEVARKSIDQNVARKKLKHYSSSMAKAGLKQGGQMAIRQGLGVVFTEVAGTIMDEIPNIIKEMKSNFSLEKLFNRIGELIEIAFECVKSKMSDVLEAIKIGFTSGIFSSIVTTIINMFTTTAKNIVRLVRQSMVSITEAIKILFFDKENRTTGERVIAASKVIMTGASVVLGVLVEQSLSASLQSSGIGVIPIIGGILMDIIPIFMGTLLTGLLSITFLYFMDNSDKIKRLIEFINKISEDCFDRALGIINQAHLLLDKYIAELCNIDIESLRQQVADIHEVNFAIAEGDNEVLYRYCNKSGIKLQFNNTREFIKLMLSDEALDI